VAILVGHKIGVGREICERWWVAHGGAVELGLIVRIVIPGVITLAESELVDQSRTELKQAAEAVATENRPALGT
jgi:3-dehydroquinate synthetase